MLDAYTIKAKVSGMTFNGPKDTDIHFTLVVAPEFAEFDGLVKGALGAMTEFLVDASIDDDVSLN